jgi:hypothetical protein
MLRLRLLRRSWKPAKADTLPQDLVADAAKAIVGASPEFPVDLYGVGELHAAFLNESRTRRRWWRAVAGNPGRPSFSAHVRWGERGAPVLCLWSS